MPLGVDGSFGLDKYGNVKIIREGELIKNVLSYIFITDYIRLMMRLMNRYWQAKL